ncbi:MAG: DUF3303 domain-containing protein [Dehalococcoidia bacterium]|nr:DUF3303 domain-containing protein [Dehalococcoidia bacterium]
MLFMSIYTYEPENREAVIKRRAEKGASVPAGVKVVGEWTSLAGHRVFRVTEVEDPRALYAAISAWLDLGKVEIFPVMPTEEIMKLLTSKK